MRPTRLVDDQNRLTRVGLKLTFAERQHNFLSPINRKSEWPMRVLFQPLRECPDLRTVLRADGWSLEGARNDAVLAEHPGVADEDAARSRLHRLDLLTSAGLRIEFLPA